MRVRHFVLLSQRLAQALQETLVLVHSLHQLRHLRHRLMERQPLKAFGQRLADGVERIAVEIACHLHHLIADNAHIRHDDDQRGCIRHRYELNRANLRHFPRRRQYHGGVACQGGKHLCGVVYHILHLMHPPQKMSLDRRVAIRRNAPRLQQLIDIEPIRFCGRDASRGDMRLIEVAQFLQIAHLIADGRGGQAHVVFLRDGS